MAVTNGFVDTGDGVGLKKFKKTGEREDNSLNIRVKDHTNGCVKSTYSNGATHERTELEGGLPKIDWSKYNTFPGSFEKCSVMTAALTHFGLYILMFLGFINQLIFKPKAATEKNREGYAPLYDPFEQFFFHYIYRRVRHCFNRPICSSPGAELVFKERESTNQNWTFNSFKFTGAERRCVNLASYNYLGFAEGAGSYTARKVAEAVSQYGIAVSSSRAELGTTPLHKELEKATADFFGVEDAIVFGMGFATNTLSIPGLIGPGTLVLSDENNHASLILGLRLSRAAVRVFRHNDVRHAETLARAAIAEGKWTNILIMADGVYGKAGSVVALEGFVALKRALGLQLYVDEAHSVGALGETGRGVHQRCRVLAKDVDILMGTFTKGFAAAGGYIAGPRRLVQWLRLHGHGHIYSYAMSIPDVAKALAAMRTMDTPLGAKRAKALAVNTTYFRRRLREIGVVTFGHPDSPMVPMLVYTFSKLRAAIERLTQAGVATVGLIYPATPFNQARIRFCISASHSREQLDKCLAAIEQVADELGLRYSRLPRPIADTHTDNLHYTRRLA